MYDAAIAVETTGDWTRYAVGGSVRAISHTDNADLPREPAYGTQRSDDYIRRQVVRYIASLRKMAGRMEAALHCYGPSAFRKTVAQVPAPSHPFDAEAALLALINGGADEIIIHGVRFVKDRSNAFVKAE